MPPSLCICGASKGNDVELLLDPSMAKPFKKRHFCRYHTGGSTKNKNPYSSRGLDTFEALLLDLQEKKKKIYTKNNDHLGGGISLVRFTYSSSNDLVPIIVKNKDYNDKDKNMRGQLAKSLNREEEIVTKNDHVHYWRRPCYYMPAVLMVLLVLLVFFGRSVAILCTSIGWYVVPALGSGSVEEERVLARSGPGKKVLRRIWSDSRVMQLSEKRPKKLCHLRSLS